jgi:hypothetical protein
MLFLRTTSKRRVAKGARRTHAFIHRSGSTVAATVGERKHVEKRIAFDLEPPIAGHQSFMKRFGGHSAARLLPTLRGLHIPTCRAKVRQSPLQGEAGLCVTFLLTLVSVPVTPQFWLR